MKIKKTKQQTLEERQIDLLQTYYKCVVSACINKGTINLAQHAPKKEKVETLLIEIGKNPHNKTAAFNLLTIIALDFDAESLKGFSSLIQILQLKPGEIFKRQTIEQA